MTAIFDRVIQKSQILYTGINRWRPREKFQMTAGSYLLKLADTPSEVLDCFKLRHDIFCIEMAGESKKSRLDHDRYDLLCDHLMIVHRETGKIVGTYRLNFSDSSFDFYTLSEFQIQPWLQSRTEPILELGRACIAEEHRRGIVISLLWRGIWQYMQIKQAGTLIGCSSVRVTDAAKAALIYRYFEYHNLIADEIFRPQPHYEMKDFFFELLRLNRNFTDEEKLEAENLLPPLLNSYLKAGARIASYPAFDSEFKCIDFVTRLEVCELKTKVSRKLALR